MIRIAHLSLLVMALIIPATHATAQSFGYPTKTCRSATISSARGTKYDAVATYDLAKLVSYYKQPTLKTGTGNLNEPRLVIATAHRGYWEYCPENTLESFQWAMDLGAEIVEMDIRPTGPGADPTSGVYYNTGEIVLTHDYDLRGENASIRVGARSTNLLFKLSPSQALTTGRNMVDRYGNPAKDSDGNPVKMHSLTDLLDSYTKRVLPLSTQFPLTTNKTTLQCVLPGVFWGVRFGEVAATKITRGSYVVLDIKGDDEQPDVVPGADADHNQLGTLLETFKEIRDYECTHQIDLSSAIGVKMSGNKMIASEGPDGTVFLTAAELDTKLQEKLDPSKTVIIPPDHLPHYGIIFIVYPNDVPEGLTSSATTSQQATADAFKNWLPTFTTGTSGYTNYLVGDWQYRWPGQSLQSYVQQEFANGRGVANFIPTNGYPEGYRNSDGTCCGGNQALAIFNSSAIDFLAPSPALAINTEVGWTVRATSVTTDVFGIVSKYLTRMMYRDTTAITTPIN